MDLESRWRTQGLNLIHVLILVPYSIGEDKNFEIKFNIEAIEIDKQVRKAEFSRLNDQGILHFPKQLTSSPMTLIEMKLAVEKFINQRMERNDSIIKNQKSN